MVHYKWTILAASLPRLAYTGFTFAQPFLIDRVLSFTSSSPENRSANVAYGLIGAYAIVYIGAAVCESISLCFCSNFSADILTLVRAQGVPDTYQVPWKLDHPDI